MRRSITTTLISLVLIASVGCDDGAEPVGQERSAEPTASPSPAIVDAPELPSAPSQAPAAAPELGSWQPWLDTEVARVQLEAPAWFEHLMTVEPKLAHSGILRLVGPEFEDPSAAPVLLHRYLTAGEPAEVRAAVVSALVLTGTDYAAVIGDLLGSEPDASVRIHMVSSLRRVPGPAAVAALELAFADVDAQVRMNAAIAAARHPDGASLAAPLIAALDDEPEVRLAAVESLGYLHIESATSALTALLASADAKLRLGALQAIDRIDPAYAAGLGQLSALSHDADPKVARAAQKIANR